MSSFACLCDQDKWKLKTNISIGTLNFCHALYPSENRKGCEFSAVKLGIMSLQHNNPPIHQPEYV